MTICLSAPHAAIGAPVDCGPAPTVKCVADAVFALAKTLPDDSYYRKHVAFAEEELAPGSIKTALDYVTADYPDPSPWQDIDWIAQAGRLDRAIQLARQQTEPVVRLGGLLATASYMLDKNDSARAGKIVDEVERDLPLVKADDRDGYVTALRRDAGEVRARLGQTGRATRLLAGAGAETVGTALMLAGKYPAAAGLRELAWREAERVNEPYDWMQLVEDASNRGDQADLAKAAHEATAGLTGVLNADYAENMISLAGVLLKAGLPQFSAKLVEPWDQWINRKERNSRANVVNDLIPVLVGLGQDRDVEAAARYCVNGVFERTGCLGKAAAEYFRVGRSDIATKFDREALFVASASPSGEPKQRAERDLALHNLALVRAGHGDIQGALGAVAKLSNDAKMHEVTSYVVRNAINDGYGPVVEPAIEALQRAASATRDASYLLQAAKAWYDVGNEESALRNLDEAMKVVRETQAVLGLDDLSLAVELSWRINGKGEAKAMLPIVDKFGVNDPNAIDRLVEIMKPVSPAVAVQLAARQTEPERQIDEIAGIGIAIAGGTK